MSRKQRIIFAFFLACSFASCEKRTQNIKEQVVTYFPEFNADDYVKVQQTNGNLVYFPKDLVPLLSEDELKNFNPDNYTKATVNGRSYFVPRDRQKIRQVQNIRSEKFKKLEKDLVIEKPRQKPTYIEVGDKNPNVIKTIEQQQKNQEVSH